MKALHARNNSQEFGANPIVTGGKTLDADDSPLVCEPRKYSVSVLAVGTRNRYSYTRERAICVLDVDREASAQFDSVVRAADYGTGVARIGKKKDPANHRRKDEGAERAKHETQVTAGEELRKDRMCRRAPRGGIRQQGRFNAVQTTRWAGRGGGSRGGIGWPRGRRRASG